QGRGDSIVLQRSKPSIDQRLFKSRGDVPRHYALVGIRRFVDLTPLTHLDSPHRNRTQFSRAGVFRTWNDAALDPSSERVWAGPFRTLPPTSSKKRHAERIARSPRSRKSLGR